MKRRTLAALLALSLVTSLPAIASEPLDAIASGEGSNREAALTSALRHAIEQVVGMQVSTRTYVTNLKQIEDRVLTQASGYIQSYEVADEARTPQGGYRVTVVAKVAQEKLKTDIAPFVGSTVAFDGKTVMANFQVQQASQIELEREMKSWLDRLETEGIVAKPVYTVEPVLSNPAEVKFTLTGVETQLEPSYYSSFKEFRKRAETSPYWGEISGFVKNYVYYQSIGVEFLDSSNTVIHSNSTWYGRDYFNIFEVYGKALVGKPLPVKPLQWAPKVPEHQYWTIQVPKDILSETSNIRLKYTDNKRNWPRKGV